MLAGAAADLDLAPAGLDLGADDDALVEDFDPAGAFVGLIGTAVETDDFGAAQAAGKAKQQDGAVAQPAQIAIQSLDHAQHVIGEHGFLLIRRPAMLAADAAHHLGNVAVGAIERRAVLGKPPGHSREPPLDRAHRRGLAAGRRLLRGAVGEIEADHLRVRREGGHIAAAAPGLKMAPVAGVGALGGGALAPRA